MARRFLDTKTRRFYFVNAAGERKSYLLIFGDEVKAPANPTGVDPEPVQYRGRDGEWKRPPLTTKRALEMYFLDVGQGDAAFVVTPNDTKILVDGGLRERALGFLIWKYRLDEAANSVTIDHLFLSHADKDHVEGLIPLLRHPQITVREIHHNGIGLFDSGFNTVLGNKTADGRLTTVHNTAADLNGQDLASGRGAVFADWIRAVRSSGARYRRRSRATGILDIGDPDVTVEIVGPILNADGSLPWLSDKSHTINGHSLTFRLTYGSVRTFFSGDLNQPGSERLLNAPSGSLSVDSHIFKAPHHGSHEFDPALFEAVNPLVTIVSSGESPDHGHPRASFLGAIGNATRRPASPLLFSTELAALFDDTNEPAAPVTTTATLPADIEFASSPSNTDARLRFKKLLPGIINVRTNGEDIYVFRRVQQSYQWESYGPHELALR